MAAALGADMVIDRRAEDFVAVVKEATGGRGADVIYDPVGGDTFARSTKCVAFEGRHPGHRLRQRRHPVRADLSHALVKNYSIVGLHWGLYRKHDPAIDPGRTTRPDRARRRTAWSCRWSARGSRSSEAPDGIARLAAGDTDRPGRRGGRMTDARTRPGAAARLPGRAAAGLRRRATLRRRGDRGRQVQPDLLSCASRTSGPWVLRRPPLGHVLATAHDMAREYRVMSALGADRRAGAAHARCCAPTRTSSARRST